MTKTAEGIVPGIATVDVDRRKFLNRTMIAALGVLGAAMGAGSIAALWPEPVRGRFGSTINAGKIDDVLAQLERDGRPIYSATGKYYIVAYDTSDPDNMYVRNGFATNGVMVLYQKCSHLGCRVPYCPTSKYFECPCHGALFSGAGEARGGPVPGGMWRFPVAVDADGYLQINTRTPGMQPARGTDTTGQDPLTHCLGDVRVEF